MKIGIISHLKHPVKQPFAGGLEAFTFEVTLRLEKRGHEVVLFASEYSDANLPLVSILSDRHYNQETGVRARAKDISSEYIAEHHAYHRLMSEIDGYGFDIIFNNSLHYIPITMANIIRTPMVTVLHTPPFYELAMAVKAEQNYPCINYCTVSQKNAKSWINTLLNCEIIHNGIDLYRWRFYEQGKQQNYAVWFGRIHPDKGLEYAIKAAKLAKIPLKIAGGIGDSRYYASKIEPLLHNDIQMLGLLNHTEINTLVGQAQVCIVTPTWQEPFGLVVAEAMACGTPIAGFNMGALEEIVSNETGVLVPFGEVEQLAKALTTASGLNRETIRIYCEENFDIDKMVDEYEHILEKYATSQLVFSAINQSS